MLIQQKQLHSHASNSLESIKLRQAFKHGKHNSVVDSIGLKSNKLPNIYLATNKNVVQMSAARMEKLRGFKIAQPKTIQDLSRMPSFQYKNPDLPWMYLSNIVTTGQTPIQESQDRSQSQGPNESKQTFLLEPSQNILSTLDHKRNSLCGESKHVDF